MIYARQLWECVPCRRTVTVLFHTGAPTPIERSCTCGRPMGLVLRAVDDEQERCTPRAEGRTILA